MIHVGITPVMAAAVGQSPAEKILIPVNRCSNMVVGVEPLPVNALLEKAVAMISEAVNSLS